VRCRGATLSTRAAAGGRGQTRAVAGIGSVARGRGGGGIGGDGDVLFVSYSHADARWVQRFEVLLKPLVEAKRLSVWTDRALRAGDRWHPEIEAAVACSRVALLLVSADFLASEFIMRDELPALVRHGVRLAPVLLRDCLWEVVPELAQVQWLHDPGRDGALGLEEADEAHRDRSLVGVCRKLLALVPTPAPAPAGAAVDVGVAAREAAQATAVGAVSGELFGVPPLPPGYVVREELDGLVAALLGTGSGSAVGLTAPAAGAGLHGPLPTLATTVTPWSAGGRRPAPRPCFREPRGGLHHARRGHAARGRRSGCRPRPSRVQLLGQRVGYLPAQAFLDLQAAGELVDVDLQLANRQDRSGDVAASISW
jgi:hypothetical protein